MSKIIEQEEFDRIYDKIIYKEKLERDMWYLTQAQRNYYVEKFLRENCYKVYYENQLFYILTDAYISQFDNSIGEEMI
jgi:hypothetical protein